jgi:ABC-type nickel/cobalt efflux system permease component RcnA
MGVLKMTLRDWLEIIAVLLAATPGVWAIVWQIRKERRAARKEEEKAPAETAKIFTEIASDLTRGMKNEMERQNKKIVCLEKKQEIYEKVTRQLIKQVEALGCEPEVSLAELDRMLNAVSTGG